MPELYGRSPDGTNRKIRELYGLAGGTNRKLRELWGRDGEGFNRKVFVGGIPITLGNMIEEEAFEGYVWSKGRSITNGNIHSYVRVGGDDMDAYAGMHFALILPSELSAVYPSGTPIFRIVGTLHFDTTEADRMDYATVRFGLRTIDDHLFPSSYESVDLPLHTLGYTSINLTVSNKRYLTDSPVDRCYIDIHIDGVYGSEINEGVSIDLSLDSFTFTPTGQQLVYSS